MNARDKERKEKVDIVKRERERERKSLCMRVRERKVLLTSPDARILFKYSRKASSLISLSVKRKVIPFPCWPAVR